MEPKLSEFGHSFTGNTEIKQEQIQIHEETK